MSVTIQNIADAAGVSRGTVDRALNNRGRINPDVEKRIKSIAKELGYVPNRKREKKHGSTIKIGVLTQLSKASFMIQIHKGIEVAEKELKTRKIELCIEECFGVDEKEQMEALERLQQQGVQGIAAMPVESDIVREKLNRIIEKGIPVVTFNSDIVGTKRQFFVGLDNIKSGHTAAGLMAMLCADKGKVLVITGCFSNSVNNKRVDGFAEEINENFTGIELVGVQSSMDNADQVEKIIENTLKVYPDLAGILVISSGQNGIRRAFEKLNLKKRPHVIIYDLTPKNIKILEDDIADFVIDQNGYMQGYQALHILADIIQKQDLPGKECIYTDIIIKTKYNI